MATTRQDIKAWLEEGIRKGCTHMLVVVDTYDYDDYPVYVQPGQDPHVIYKGYHGNNMQRVMEVYNLSKPIEAQLNEYRSFNF